MRSFSILAWTVFTTDPLDTLESLHPPPLRQRLCHTTGCEPVLGGDDFVAGRAWPYQEALHARVGFYLVAFSLVFVFILVLFDLSW